MGCQSCIRRVQRNLLSICHWKNDEFWMKFVLWAKKFRTLPKFYCRFPKLQSTCQEKNCEREWNWKNDDSLVILKLWVKKLDSEQNNWAGVVKTTFGVSRGILWQFFNEKRLVFHVFLHFEQNHCLLLPNIYGRVSETSIYVSGGKNWEKKNEKKRLFLGNFVLWVKKIGLRAKQFGKGCQSFIRRVQRNLFSFSIGKTMIFEWFSHFERKSSGLCQKSMAGFPKLQTTCPEKNFEREKLWKNDDFLVILYFEWKKLDFGQNNSAGVVIAAVGVSRGIFWAVLLGKTMIFDCFSYSERKCSGLCIKLTAGCLKLQSTCREKFLTWEKRKNEEFSVILYSELDKWTLDKTVWHGLSKLHSACPEESFEHFSLEKRWLLKDFRTLSRKSSGLCQKSMAGFPKLQTTCPEKNFERENFWKNDDFVVILYFEWKKIGFWAKQFCRGCHSCSRRF